MGEPTKPGWWEWTDADGLPHHVQVRWFEGELWGVISPTRTPLMRLGDMSYCGTWGRELRLVPVGEVMTLGEARAWGEHSIEVGMAATCDNGMAFEDAPTLEEWVKARRKGGEGG